MQIIVSGLKTSITQDSSEAVSLAIMRLGVPASLVQSAHIAKTSLDARRRSDVHFIHSVILTFAVDDPAIRARCDGKQIRLCEQMSMEPVSGVKKLHARPVIAGFGPAGMFAGLLLARCGYRPLILERGAAMERRVAAVERFWKDGTLDPSANVQFGEGGAGTFSDGKLTTRISDAKCGFVLEELVKFGAPKEILYQSKPHVGTDRLRDVVTGIRREIEALGGEILFETPLEGLDVRDGALYGVKSGAGEIETQALILATGHSARDTFTMLHQSGIAMQPKPFSVGVRIEHLQSEIDRGLYGDLAGHPSLPKGEYQLSHRMGERGVYTFCMCPGGYVIPSASHPGTVVTNGMSLHARDGKNANSALVVSVSAQDFGPDALDGMRFQERLESAAFLLGGKNYCAPAQDVGSFLAGKPGLQIGRVEPSYALGVTPCDFGAFFPGEIAGMLKTGLQAFDRKLSGFSAADSILTGVETRTSSPVRITRGGETLQSESVSGLYPCAEGAGYAGGIMSAAVDGLRVALKIIETYQPLC